MKQTRFVIVGAGVTGLAFANFADVPASDLLILERDSAAGGYCKTVKQDGFVWDYSGHFFHFRDPEVEAYLRARMDPDEVATINKSSGVLYEGTRIDFPFQKNIHQLPQADFIDCLYDLWFRDTERPQNTFEDMLYARFGKSIAEKFLVPYNEKLYACPMTALDADAMGRFFPYADVDDIIRNFRPSEDDNGGYNASFTYPTGGAIRYVEALLSEVAPESIRFNAPLVELDVKQRIAHTPDGPVQYEHLISSMPFPRLLQLADVPHDPSVYTWNKVLVFNLGFDRKGWEQDHWVYIPQRDVCFYRVGFYDNIFKTDRMSLYIEIGMRADQDPGDVNEWLAQVLVDLRKVGIVEDHELVSWHSVVLDPAYVHITGESRADFAQKSAALAQRGVHSVGRYGGWTYCSIEDNILEARALAQRLS
jgi:protoporphyrinogen oxidase